MSTSVRQTITFTAPQMTFLKEESARLGITIGELLRRIIDAYREARAPS
jgi:hypothetical protein